MRCRKIFLFGLTFWPLAFASGCALFADHSQGRGEILEKWQAENKTFKIRVSSYKETQANVNGAYYRFESAALGSNDWREIVTFRHDDQPKIPSEQIRFLNDDIGYLFMGWMYAVTTDAGRSWSVWTAEKDLPNWQCCNYGLIQDVTVTQDGRGLMRLNPVGNRPGEVPELQTNDYGKHWQAR